MKKSESINELAAALSKAQAEIQGAVRDSDNPFFKSKYADLESVWAACRGPLTKNGLSIIQAPHSITSAEGKVTACVTTMMLHSSGQWIEESCECPLAKADAQGLTAAITYTRRTGVACFAGVAPTDDDGEAAVGRGDTKQPSPARAAMNASTPAAKADVKPLPEGDPMAAQVIKQTIESLAADRGMDYAAFDKDAKQFIKLEFGISTKAQAAAMDMAKAQKIIAGLHAEFGKQQREPGQDE